MNKELNEAMLDLSYLRFEMNELKKIRCECKFGLEQRLYKEQFHTLCNAISKVKLYIYLLNN